MARTGSFGRLPRSVPSLTNTLIAIAREQQQQEDQNIMDAWQKGGSVNGKKVTDKMVLDHWRTRLEDISTDDPLYDTYKNAIQQYEYTIAESKMTANYAQIVEPKSGDDSAMAAFYMNWSKKVPKDSEFYRILLRDAGQFMRSAKAKRDQVQRKDTEKEYKTRMDRLEKTHELPGQTALRVVTLLGQEGSQGRGAVLGESPLGGTKAIVDSTNISSLQLPGAEQMIALLGTVMTGEDEAAANHNGRVKVGVNSQVLYTDESGKPVTGKDIVNMFKSVDPSFDGNFNMAYVQGLIKQQRDGIQKRIDLAKKTGHVSDMMSLQQQQAKINEYGREIAAWPVAAEYQTLHDQLKKTMADADAGLLLPDAAGPAIEKLRSQIGALADDKRIAADGHMQSQLRAEAAGSVGSLTLAEDLAGFHDGYANPTGDSDIEYVNSKLEVWQEQRDAVAAGEMVYTQGDYVKGADGKTKFVPSTQGPSVGAAPMAAINNLPGTGKPVPVMVPNGDGGGATPMYVVPAPVIAVAKNADGSPMQATNSNPVCGYIRYKVNGVETTLYSLERDGKTTWSFDPPWDASKVKTSEANGVITVSIEATPGAGTVDLSKDADLGNGFQVVGSKPATRTSPGQPGQIVYDPKAATYGTDGARQVAGHDPYTDSFSASLAALKTAPDGANLLQQWTGDPRFMSILDNNAHLSAGQTLDATTGIWTGGDPNAYQKNMSLAQQDIREAKAGRVLGGSWDRETTSTKLDGAPAGTVPGPSGSPVPTPSGVRDLPTTTIQNDPNAKMKALAGSMSLSGQIVFKGKQEDDRAIPSIKVGQPLTVPGVSPSATPAPLPSPVPTPAPTSSGVVPKPSPTPTPTAPPPTSTYANGSGSYSSGNTYGNKPS